MCVVWWISDEFLSGISEACWVAHIRSPRLPRMYFLDWSDGWYSDRAMRPWDQVGDGGDMCPCAILRLSMCRAPRAACRGPNNLISWWLLITDPGGQLLSGTAMSEDPNKVTGDNIIPGNTGRRSWSQNVKQNNEWMNETDKVHAATLEWAQWL